MERGGKGGREGGKEVGDEGMEGKGEGCQGKGREGERKGGRRREGEERKVRTPPPSIPAYVPGDHTYNAIESAVPVSYNLR